MAEDEIDQELIQAVTAALERGQKIQAIKVYKEATGKGLKDSKDFVEALIPKLVEQDPQRFARLTKSGGGCGNVILITTTISSLAAALIIWFNQ
jgi:Ribosomal protein L7/L12 C-terminal domain